ncbi:MAG TPA: N-acetylmuramoyl-L-alanine amidase [Phycisphaerae bacterium]|nr:N-acetylmuramoyl-L-alanine amidase [Phycisphaerales bacterium]HRX83482.1 N-acetylmuramoyl-L-alanine amidase [Phycisphaerae bacterium]
MRAVTWQIARFSPVILALCAGACRAPRPQTDHATVRGDQQTTPAPAIADEAEDVMVSTNTLLPAPDDYARQRIDTAEFPVPAYAEYLKGVRICLDPGHGGDAHKRGYKRGPTGVREAEMNLRVAQYLRDLLEYAGAEVKLTREGDTDLSLAERAQVANDWGADLFISCHHNAIGNKPQVNHTTVWYHADIDFRPSDVDLARHLCHGLMDALDFEEITAVPLKSDQLMYESGFGVLRAAKVTAALCETSFFTNPEEEQRLRDPEHNLREAYGMFMGLAWYAFGGLPRAELTAPADGVLSADAERALVFTLDDGLRARGSWGADRQMIVSDSIGVRLDGAPLPFTFRNEGYVLTAELPDDVAAGEHVVTVHFANLFKNAVLNPNFTLLVE